MCVVLGLGFLRRRDQGSPLFSTLPETFYYLAAYDFFVRLNREPKRHENSSDLEPSNSFPLLGYTLELPGNVKNY